MLNCSLTLSYPFGNPSLTIHSVSVSFLVRLECNKVWVCLPSSNFEFVWMEWEISCTSTALEFAFPFTSSKQTERLMPGLHTVCIHVRDVCRWVHWNYYNKWKSDGCFEDLLWKVLALLHLWLVLLWSATNQSFQSAYQRTYFFDFELISKELVFNNFYVMFWLFGMTYLHMWPK